MKQRNRDAREKQRNCPCTSYNSGYTKCLPQAQHRHFFYPQNVMQFENQAMPGVMGDPGTSS